MSYTSKVVFYFIIIFLVFIVNMFVATLCHDCFKVSKYHYEVTSVCSSVISSKNQHHGQITWSGDGKWLAVTPFKTKVGPVETEVGHLPVFKYQNKSVKPSKYVNLSNISSASFLNWTNRNLVIGNLNGEVFIWDLKRRKTTVQVEYVEKNPVDFISVNSDDNYIATASLSSNKICLHSLKTNKVVDTVLLGDSNRTSSLKFCPGKKYLLGASSMESEVCVWDTFKSECVFKTSNPTSNARTDVAFSPINYNVIASVNLTKALKTYDLRTGKLVLNSNIKENLSCVDFSVNENEVALGTTSGCLIMFDLRGDKTLTSEYVHTSPILAVKVQNQKISNGYQYVDLDTEKVEVASKTLDISVQEIFSPINFNTMKDVTNETSIQSRVVSYHSTPKIVFSESGIIEDSFLNQILSPVPQSLKTSMLSQASPTLLPISEKSETIKYLEIPKAIKDNTETSENMNESIDRFHKFVLKKNAFYNDIIKEIKNAQMEAINETKSYFDSKINTLQGQYEKLYSSLGEVKEKIDTSNCDVKLDHINYRILLNDLNKCMIANLNKVNDEVVFNSLRLQHIHSLIKK